MTFTIDIELTNRCNAKCHFCPRDQTPHQGTMSLEVFEASLGRAVEFRDQARELLGEELGTVDQVSLCGLGEPLLNKNAAAMVRRVKDEGFTVGLSSNGALLDERRGRAVLDAGLDRIFLNIGDKDEGYEEVYQLPFDRTVANVERFLEMADGRCEVWLVLVDFRSDMEHLETMRAFWRARGIRYFQDFSIMNRGGALYVDHMQFMHLPQLGIAQDMIASRGGGALCGAPFGYLFIGYDGNYYLCCSDWKKEVGFGTVFDRSFIDIIGPKLQYVSDRGAVCATCNLDPTNRLTDELRARDDGLGVGDIDALADKIQADTGYVVSLIDGLAPTVRDSVERSAGKTRRLIPVTTT